MYNEGFCKKNINFWGPCDVKKTFFIPRVPYSVLGFYFMHNIWHNAGIWTRVAATAFFKIENFAVCARGQIRQFLELNSLKYTWSAEMFRFSKIAKKFCITQSYWTVHLDSRVEWFITFCDFQQKIGNFGCIRLQHTRGKVFIFLS